MSSTHTLLYKDITGDEHLPKSGLMSVWITSTKLASEASSETSFGVSSKWSRAGSRPAKWILQNGCDKNDLVFGVLYSTFWHKENIEYYTCTSLYPYIQHTSNSPDSRMSLSSFSGHVSSKTVSYDVNLCRGIFQLFLEMRRDPENRYSIREILKGWLFLCC